MELGKMFKRFPTLFPPIFKDCSYRLITNKLTWVLVAILMLPCALGLLVYYEFSGDRISEEVNGEKIYYTSSGELLHEDLRVLFLEISEPETDIPFFNRANAIPDIPIPPKPMKW